MCSSDLFPSHDTWHRICHVFGSNYNERLVPVEENTSIIGINGFVGKPDYAKKVRGEQFFFINNRFIKDAYLNHAVSSAFEELLPQGTYPSYFLFFTIDPARIDVNIHPTKTEIKMEDEKSVYAILRSSVKRALGKYSIAPTLDFDQEQAINVPLSKLNQPPLQPQIKINREYNPFKTVQPNPVPANEIKVQRDWEKLYAIARQNETDNIKTAQIQQATSHYMFNPSINNPAFYGSQDGFNFGANYRHQWAKLDGQPATVNVFAQMCAIKH